MLGLSPRTPALLAGVLLLGACQDAPTAPMPANPTTPQLAAGGNGTGNGNANGPPPST